MRSRLPGRVMLGAHLVLLLSACSGASLRPGPGHFIEGIGAGWADPADMRTYMDEREIAPVLSGSYHADPWPRTYCNNLCRYEVERWEQRRR